MRPFQARMTIRLPSSAGSLALATAALLLATGLSSAQIPTAPSAEGGPAPPTNLTVRDHPFDNGRVIDLSWTPSVDDPGPVVEYAVYRSLTESEARNADTELRTKAIRSAKEEATARTRASAAAEGLSSRDTSTRIRSARRDAARRAAAEVAATVDVLNGETRFKLISRLASGERSFSVGNLSHEEGYFFRVEALTEDGRTSAPLLSSQPFIPRRQWFDGGRFYLFIITLIFGGSVVYFIARASSGQTMKIRKIAALEAVDEAVGRATEMGRSCIYVPGIQDMNDIQTIASMTILSRVSRTAAGYDVKVQVPTARSLVMTTAREIVEAAFLAAGRPDSYNRDLIYYVTDEQFGYVAYLSGLMVREKPATCFYMGTFFAESLILAETGNSIGAIQVAGTAMPAQLPFFVAACDYTLIGEEFFAASAYLSGSPEELGSLKGQDVGKVIVGVILLTGVALATLASITGSEALAEAVHYLRYTILT
jgi:hypothetical protein